MSRPVKEVIYSLKRLDRPEGLLRKAEDKEEGEESGWKRKRKVP
jgi:hypothetical protein